MSDESENEDYHHIIETYRNKTYVERPKKKKTLVLNENSLLLY